METRYYLCVKGIIRDAEGRWLLLLRSGSSAVDPGKWDFPGGKLDPGELFDDAFRREVMEESGLDVAITGIAGASSWEMPERKVAYLFVEATPRPGEVVLSDEHVDYTWATPAVVCGYDLATQYATFARDYLGRGAPEKQ